MGSQRKPSSEGSGQSKSAQARDEKEKVEDLKQKDAKEDSGSSEQKSSKKGETYPNSIQCFRCKDFGHHMRDCKKL